MSNWHAPPHGAKWTESDHIQAEIKEKDRIIDHWKYKMRVAQMYLDQNKEKIKVLNAKLEGLK